MKCVSVLLRKPTKLLFKFPPMSPPWVLFSATRYHVESQRVKRHFTWAVERAASSPKLAVQEPPTMNKRQQERRNPAKPGIKHLSPGTFVACCHSIYGCYAHKCDISCWLVPLYWGNTALFSNVEQPWTLDHQSRALGIFDFGVKSSPRWGLATEQRGGYQPCLWHRFSVANVPIRLLPRVTLQKKSLIILMWWATSRGKK